MGALPPALTFAALRRSARMNTALLPSPRSPCFTCTAFTIIPSPNTLRALSPLSHATPQLDRSPFASRLGSRLRHSLAGSSLRTAESSSLSYGLILHLPLLRTPPRGDALSFSYRPESACLTRTLTSLTLHARRRTSAGSRPQPKRGHASPSAQTLLMMVRPVLTAFQLAPPFVVLIHGPHPRHARNLSADFPGGTGWIP